MAVSKMLDWKKSWSESWTWEEDPWWLSENAHGVLWKGLSTSKMLEQLEGKQPRPSLRWVLNSADAKWLEEKTGGLQHLTVEDVVHLNSRFNPGGTFRHTCRALTLSGSYFAFADSTPKKLKKGLQNLIERLKEEVPVRKGLAERFKVAAEFIGRFLLLHPFQDGNGRTAEVMLAALLHDQLGFYMKFRDESKGTQKFIMLHCLENERVGNKQVMAPRLLCSYMIHAAWLSHQQQVVSLQMLVDRAKASDKFDHDQAQRLLDAIVKDDFPGKEEALKTWNEVHSPEFKGTRAWKCSNDA